MNSQSFKSINCVEAKIFTSKCVIFVFVTAKCSPIITIFDPWKGDRTSDFVCIYFSYNKFVNNLGTEQLNPLTSKVLKIP